MGPAATVDFLRKLVAATPARSDQEHVPLIVRFCPEVPDRVDALLGRGPSPRQALVHAAQSIEQSGAACLAIPCNSAHVWHGEIAAALAIPVLHIADAAIAALRTGQRVGLLATAATLSARIYQQRGPHVTWVEPAPQELDRLIMPGIRAIKANDLAGGAALMLQAARQLVARDAEAILLGCTEIPLVLSEAEAGVPLIDATLALAQECVRWAGAAGAERLQ